MIRITPRPWFWLTSVSLFFFLWHSVLNAECQRYSSFILNGSYGVADSQGVILEGCNVDDQFIPASLVKIVTALTAFQVLGPDYKFVTEFAVDGEENLYIKGHGDPLLLSEEVKAISARLALQGISRVHDIVIDDSAYSGIGFSPGSSNSENPYDAPVGATAVNFNSVPVQVNSQGGVSSSEPQTPTLPIMNEAANGLRATRKRINICQQECRPQVRSSQYCCQLFTAFLKEAGISINGNCRLNETSPEARLIYSYSNPRPLAETIQAMLHYSSNFIANQLFLANGASMYGYPATWEKGRKAAGAVLSSILSPKELQSIQLVEGAGLSRSNRMTVRSMLKILSAFRPYHHLLRKYYGVPSKTGTLQGVYNYAGYLSKDYSYVLFMNQAKNGRSRLLRALKKKYPASQK